VTPLQLEWLHVPTLKVVEAECRKIAEQLRARAAQAREELRRATGMNAERDGRNMANGADAAAEMIALAIQECERVQRKLKRLKRSNNKGR
jgi:hypothetical protein